MTFTLHVETFAAGPQRLYSTPECSQTMIIDGFGTVFYNDGGGFVNKKYHGSCEGVQGWHCVANCHSRFSEMVCLIGVCIDTNVIYQSVLEK